MNRTNEIFDYKILQAGYTIGLGQEVKQYIDDGWEPFGSLVVEVSGETQEATSFYQPIVKYVKRW